MKYFTVSIALVTLAGVLTAGAPAKAATLKIGDPAPSMQVGKWVQGDPVTGFDSNHVYIVEFWATWCGPCRASIPHLNETWQKYKDKNLIVIGQDVWEPDDSSVPEFLKKMGDQMTYRVALDDKSQETNGAMAVNWMKAAGQNGIPTAFIVNRQGKIAWIGHPMALQESVLDEILADNFDLGAAATEFDRQQQEQEQRRALSQKLGQAMNDKDWDAADAALTEIGKSVPEAARFQIGPIRLKILLGRKDYAGADKLTSSLSDAAPENNVLQNELAWTLATTPGVDSQGLALAQKCAERANAATKGKVTGILDTLARTQFLNGQTNEAIATEQKAVDAAPDEMKDTMKEYLTRYQQGQLPDVKQ
jgi:thiol-disulfide isomerase/thioredoxin